MHRALLIVILFYLATLVASQGLSQSVQENPDEERRHSRHRRPGGHRRRPGGHRRRPAGELQRLDEEPQRPAEVPRRPAEEPRRPAEEPRRAIDEPYWSRRPEQKEPWEGHPYKHMIKTAKDCKDLRVEHEWVGHSRPWTYVLKGRCPKYDGRTYQEASLDLNNCIGYDKHREVLFLKWKYD
ncbi:hypothetical protein BDV28DRAFT_145908 [Aspergillus coremiiformis]|uniref:Secreted protein n=1 Tax=Aspergillus coremiiformis TaxID=138285 RepID=A0A5N6ZEW0_9EURO|nr:hypothetical protein BDV28DRAFT_145908 [Aspergillus coremiiformis]